MTGRGRIALIDCGYRSFYKAVEEILDLRIGLREFKTEGKEFRLNGKSIFFRGNHSGGDFPLTGYPETDVAYWKKLFELHRSWGLNHMRFHSWCPPEAAFVAADMLGFYLQPEPGIQWKCWQR